ncbi:LysR family transcriptional regulator [Pediococcus pentosaceus]|uniref:LysR family transcriptional regulator n=1 Tax=Pediococcus pentosaceus TaxID=1255 RepID=UPI00223AC82C|nr:LysR family transcriptional regulator [Pediococcus pentosaceus]MCT1176661.1 LysR family transcriptional regulator [Pediococcus pentosaceus]
MNLTTLKYFVQVATEGSLTKAADKLFISQPTLSRHMKNLEAELNTQLFVRQSHSLKLTENGITFLKATTKVIQDVDALKHFFDQHQTASNPTHYLNVGYLENFRLEKMYAVLDRISHENNIQFSLFPDTPTNLSKGLSSGKYDLIYSLRPYTTDNVLFKSTDFLENHLEIALPINHPLAAKPQLSFSDLKNETFILLDRDKSPIIVDNVLSQGIKNGYNLKANYYVKNLSQGLSMAALGNGLAFLYSAMNDGQLEKQYRIKIKDLTDNLGNQNIVIAMKRSVDNALIGSIFEKIIDTKKNR